MRLIEFFLMEMPYAKTPRSGLPRAAPMSDKDPQLDRFGNVMTAEPKFGKSTNPSEFGFKILKQQEPEAAARFGPFLQAHAEDQRFAAMHKKYGIMGAGKWVFMDGPDGIEAMIGRRTGRGQNPDGSFHHEWVNTFGLPTIVWDGTDWNVSN